MLKISTKVTAVAATILVSGTAIAQEKIKDGTVSGTVNQPSSAAILELESSNKGLLLPRVKLTNTKTWSLTGTVSTTGGMTVYNTNANIASTDDKYPAQGAGIYFWDGTGWVAGSPVEPWNKATTVFGATANNQNIYQRGYVGIGDFSNQAPGAALHIKGTSDGFAVDNIIMESISSNKNADALQILSKGFSDPAPADSNNTFLGTFGFRFNQANNSAPELNDRARLRVIYDGPTGSNPGTNMTFATAPVRSTSATERMRITGDGNVGIGTNSPTHKLHVDGVTRTKNLTNSGHAISTSDFGLYNQSNQYTRITSAVGTNAAIAFYNDGDSANNFAGTNTAMMIRNGNVGINTGNNAPSNKLVVRHDSANTSGLRLDNFKSVRFLATNASGDVIAATLPTEPWREAGTTNEATSNTQNIYQNGYIGIRNNNPQRAIDIIGEDGGNNDDIRITSANSVDSISTGGLFLNRARGTAAVPTTLKNGDRIGQISFFGHNGSSYQERSNIISSIDGTVNGSSVPTALYFRTGTTSAADRMTIRSSGNVGIGTTEPSTKLSVVGTTAYNSFQMQDGSQGQGKFMSSDASGKATWVNSPLTPIVIGESEGNQTTAFPIEDSMYLNKFITLTPGKWIIHIGHLLNAVGASEANNAWVRLTLSSDKSNQIRTGFSFLTTELVSSWLSTVGTSTEQYTFVTGTILVNVTNSGGATLYLRTREAVKKGTVPPILSRGNYKENYLFAVPTY